LVSGGGQRRKSCLAKVLKILPLASINTNFISTQTLGELTSKSYLLRGNNQTLKYFIKHPILLDVELGHPISNCWQEKLVD